MKENACKCICNKISAEKKNSLHKDCSPESSEITNKKWKCMEPLDATPKLEHNDNSCIIIESVSNLIILNFDYYYTCINIFI